MPWETVFNFCMVSLFIAGVLALLWSWQLESDRLWSTNYSLIVMTLAYVGFVVKGVRKWLKSDAR